MRHTLRAAVPEVSGDGGEGAAPRIDSSPGHALAWKEKRQLVGTDDWWAERRARVWGDHVRVLFECDQVGFRRGGAVVLEELTFGISEGATCIAGPSGAGKSTLLRLFNRLADPAGGTVRYRGRDVRDYDVLALRREVGLVPQLPALLDGTVAMNVSFGARLAGQAADVPTALRLAGLDEAFADRPAGRLSVGEQQRVMLARALALQPRVLLLDEPTAALDERSKGAVERTLVDLRARLSLSVVFVTHERAQAERLADRIVWLEGGRLSRDPSTVRS